MPDLGSQLPPAPVVSMRVAAEDPTLYHLRALPLLRINIRDLIRERGCTLKALADFVGRSKSWIGKFLKEERGLPFRDIDKIAAFFGLQAYQLLQPGIAEGSERRLHGDRRVGRERRVGPQQRTLSRLAVEERKRRPPAERGPHVATTSPVADALYRAVHEHERHINSILSQAGLGRQAATTGLALPDSPARHRAVRRPRAKKTHKS